MVTQVDVQLVQMRLDNADAIAKTRVYGNTLKKTASEMEQLGRSTQKMKGANNGALSSFGKRGIAGAAQQAGYQVADFAIVLQQGQGAMRAFAVQGGQLISAFGPYGAVIGGLVTVGGLLIQGWLDSTAGAKSLEEAVENLTGSYKLLISQEKIIDELRKNQLTNTDSALLSFYTEDNARVAKDIVASTKDLAEQVQKLSDGAAARETNPNFLGLPQLESVKRAKEEAVELQAAMEGLSEALLSGDASQIVAYWQQFNEVLETTEANTKRINGDWENLRDAVEAILIELRRVDEESQVNQQTAEETAKVYEEVLGWIEDIKKKVVEVSRSHEVMNGKAKAFVAFTKISSFFMGQIAKFTALAARDSERQAEAERIATQQYKERFSSEEEVFGQPVAPDNISQQDAIDNYNRLTEAKDEAAAATVRLSDAEREAERVRKKLKKDQEELVESMTLNWQEMIESGVGGFVDAIFDADKSFADFARNFLISIGKMIAQQALLNALKIAFGGSSAGVPLPDAATLGNIIPFAKGGVVNSPTIFPMGGGSTGVAGEAGPEAIMPIKRGSNGVLGVAGPSITINNNAGADVVVTRSDEQVIEIAVNRSYQKVQAEFNRSMQTGQGGFARSLEQGYTSRRRTT